MAELPTADTFLNRIEVFRQVSAASKTLSVLPTEKWTAAMLETETPPVKYAASKPRVVDRDCIELAFEIRCARPVVLNLSDDFAAGGAIMMGSGAQEESLWRRTALCHTQKQWLYPLCVPGKPADLLYSPEVPVLRDTEAKGYAWFPAPYRRLDFIAIPALKYPKPQKDGGLSVADQHTLEERLRLVLRVAAHKGNDVVILGAMGCGAWRSPPQAVADVFARVLPEFNGCFQQIFVAILNTSSRLFDGKSLCEVFETTLS